MDSDEFTSDDDGTSFEPDSWSATSFSSSDDQSSSSSSSSSSEFDFPRSKKSKPNALLNYLGMKVLILIVLKYPGFYDLKQKLIPDLKFFNNLTFKEQFIFLQPIGLSGQLNGLVSDTITHYYRDSGMSSWAIKFEKYKKAEELVLG